MTAISLEEEIKDLLEKWNRSILAKDLAAAGELREPGFSCVMPDGTVLTKEAELAMIASPGHTLESLQVQNPRVSGNENQAIAVFEHLIKGEYLGERINAQFTVTVCFVKTAGVWRARSSRMVSEDPIWRRRESSAPSSKERSHLRKLIPDPIKRWIRGRVNTGNSASTSSFPKLAYIPYKAGQDYAIHQKQAAASDSGIGELPIPPKELWLGYNYPVHGKTHVNKMLEVLYASDFSFKQNDRILDLGCGAGRMIRHLFELSETCEIWGTDISAEHIYWCKQHLSPPFNFATTTKVPHLPFEDRSFQFIYCGSVFTHIDDLADAWLLELKRILAPGGRLYLTIHDNHTIKLIEEGRYESEELIRNIRSRQIYQTSKDSFGMFTVGRDDSSQVFYDIDYFSKTLSSMFQIISINQEAYFYQTAILLKRRS